MSQSRGDITKVSKEQELFVKPEEKIKPNFFGFFHREQVSMGEQVLLYRDGKLLKVLEAGPHFWWTGFFHKWKIQHINLNVELIEIQVEGRVRGPSMAEERRMPTAGEFACSVKAALQLTCRIADLKPFLRYRDTLSVFLASVSNTVHEMIGQLRYDQYGQWATSLRNEIKDQLRLGGKIDSERLIGMRVEDVYVTGIEPNSAQDRNMLAMYQLVERARRELVEAQANRERDIVVATSHAEQASIVEIPPSLIHLQNSDLGRMLIDRDAELRKLMIAAGLNPGVGQPLQDPTGQLGAGPAPSVGYLNPPRPMTYGQSSAGPGQVSGQLPIGPGQVSGQIYTTGSLQPNLPPTSPPPQDTSGPPVDDARQQTELAALKQAGFIPAGSGQVVPVYDNAGQPVPGSKEWVLPVSIPHGVGYLTIIFHCPAGYPAFAPRVQVRPPSGGGLTSIEPNSVKNWNVSRSLVQVAQEVNNDIP
jgi:regulator of protease activity HflC (stomatin/prohibitin superfamily)